MGVCNCEAIVGGRTVIDCVYTHVLCVLYIAAGLLVHVSVTCV